MKKITNTKLKKLSKLNQKKYRKKFGTVIVEGFRVINHLLKNNVSINTIFFEKQEELAKIKTNDLSKIKVNKPTLRKLTSTKTPQSIVAEVPIVKKGIFHYNYLIFLDDIRDPGNMGTIIRTAFAANYDGIILSRHCCDPFNPKTIRASMGTVFTIPMQTKDKNWVIKSELTKIVSVKEHGKNIFEDNLSLNKGYILVIGSEARGIRKSIIAKSNLKITIPASNQIDSLNASVAAGILLYNLKYAN